MFELTLESKDFANIAADILNCGHSLRFSVKGGSMRPFIRPGDIVSIEPWEYSTARLGEVLLFLRLDGSPVIHRVSAMRELDGIRKLIIKGDSYSSTDETIHPLQVLGRVTLVERNGNVWSLNAIPQRFLARLWGYLVPVQSLLFHLKSLLKRFKR